MADKKKGDYTLSTTKMKDTEGSFGLKSTEESPFPKDVKHSKMKQGMNPGMPEYPDKVSDSVYKQRKAEKQLDEQGKKFDRKY